MPKPFTSILLPANRSLGWTPRPPLSLSEPFRKLQLLHLPSGPWLTLTWPEKVLWGEVKSLSFLRDQHIWVRYWYSCPSHICDSLSLLKLHLLVPSHLICLWGSSQPKDHTRVSCAAGRWKREGKGDRLKIQEREKAINWGELPRRWKGGSKRGRGVDLWWMRGSSFTEEEKREAMGVDVGRNWLLLWLKSYNNMDHVG